jgi:hypothetical protein
MQLKGIATPDKSIIPVKRKKIVKPKLNPVIPTAPIAPTQDITPTEGPAPLTGAEIAEQQRRRKAMEDAIAKNLETPVEEPTVPTTPVEVETPTIEQPQVNIADMMREKSKSATDSLVAQLKQRIAESVQAQQANIARAPQAYDPLRAESEVRKSQDLRSALERSSVLGDRGGIGRSEALATQTAGENRLTDINLQQQNYIDQANQEISRLENEGRYEEARIVADQANQLAQNLIGEQIRQEGIQREDRLASEAAQAKAMQLQDERDYELYIRELDRIDNNELLKLKQSIDQENAILDAEIREAQSIGDNQRAIQLDAVRTSNDAKLEGIKQSNRLALQEAENLQLEQPIQETTQDFINQQVSQRNPITIDDIRDDKKSTLEVIINNPQLYDNNDPVKLMAILDENKITLEELEAYEAWRDSALASRPFE